MKELQKRHEEDGGEDDAEEGPDRTAEAVRHSEAEFQQVSHEKFVVAHDFQPLAGTWESKPRQSV